MASPNKVERSLEAPSWVGHGTGHLVLRDALPASSPDSWASLWIKKYGDLDGFPTDKAEINGAGNRDSVYYKCNHCDCLNLVAKEGMIVA